jgi:hypothetical protein
VRFFYISKRCNCRTSVLRGRRSGPRGDGTTMWWCGVPGTVWGRRGASGAVVIHS